MKTKIFKNQDNLDELVLEMRNVSSGEPAKPRRVIILNLLVIVVQCCFFLLHYITSDSDAIFKLSTFDFFGLQNFPSLVQLEMIGMDLAMMHIYYVVYFKTYSMSFFGVIERVLVHQDYSFMFNTIRWNVRLWVLTLINAYEVLIVFSKISFFLSYFDFLVKLWQHEPVFSVHVFARIVCMSVAFFFFAYAFVKIERAGIMAAWITLTTLMLIFARINILRSKLIASSADQATMSQIVLYDRHNRKSIQFLLSSNHMIGLLLLTFFLLNVPLNCTLLTILLKTKQVPVQLPVLIISLVVFVAQLTVFIAFHLLAAKVKLTISDPYHRYASQYCHITKSSLHYRLKAALAIEAFYNKNPYGLTYGSLGLITMATVAKCFFLYSEAIFSII